ncbi:MAG: anti-sigma factor, partial [Gemmataceae bacterium]|nr:anti-sigma factor [Gemmataceae bacterium]
GWLAWPRAGVIEPTVAQRRDALAAAGAARYAGPGGRVIWDAAKQEGYLEVRGLAPNDPARRQYQLWIVDAGRPDKEPVDGGVFDVGPDGSALVPVRAALPIRDAAAFAVTEEAAGGVVVSRQPHLVVLTKGG